MLSLMSKNISFKVSIGDIEVFWCYGNAGATVGIQTKKSGTIGALNGFVEVRLAIFNLLVATI